MEINFSHIFLLLIFSLVFISGCVVPEPQVCGNDVCERPTENSYTCPTDCGSPPSSGNRIYEGQFIKQLDGAGNYTGEKFSVKLLAVVQHGSSIGPYLATFELYDKSANKIDTQTVAPSQDLMNVFADSQGSKVLNTSVVLRAVGVETTTGRGFVEVEVSNTKPEVETKYTVKIIDESGAVFDFNKNAVTLKLTLCTQSGNTGGCATGTRQLNSTENPLIGKGEGMYTLAFSSAGYYSTSITFTLKKADNLVFTAVMKKAIPIPNSSPEVIPPSDDISSASSAPS